MLILMGSIWFGYENYRANEIIEGHGIEFVQLAEKKDNLKAKLAKATTDDEKIALWRAIL